MKRTWTVRLGWLVVGVTLLLPLTLTSGQRLVSIGAKRWLDEQWLRDRFPAAWFRLGLWVVVVAAMVLSLSGCPGDRRKPPPTVSLMDALGNRITEVSEEARPTILARLTGLPPNQPFELMLYRDGQPVYRDAQGNPQPIVATSNGKGEIPTAVLFYDLGVDPSTGLPIPAAGNYTVRVFGSGVDFLIQLTVSRGRSRQPTTPPNVWVMRSGGRFATGSVPEGESVFVQGINFPPNRKVRLYVVRDKRGWQSGDMLEDKTGTIEEVTTNPGGTFAEPVMVWGSAQPIEGNRDFDLIADVADENGNFDNRYTPGTDAIDADLTTGFTVQGPTRVGERVDLASDGAGVYRTVFSTDESVHIWVNPPWRPLTPYMMVKKYICLHKDTWNLGDPLVDVTGRPEWDLVRYACVNQYVAVVWAPPLTPGVYDPIIDVNQNDVYDEGDILGNRFEVRGPRPKRLFVSARFPVIDPEGSTPITATLISETDRPIPNATMQFSVANAGSVINPTSAKTDNQGQASATLKAGPTGGVTITVTATATVEGVTVTGQTQVQVRAYGGINAIVRGRLRRR